jgi:protein phosphatase PTC1
VCTDQEAVELVRNIQDPVAAAKLLVDHALGRFSTDNLSCMIVRLDKDGALDSQRDNPIGVEGDAPGAAGSVSEAEKIVGAIKRGIADGGLPAVGVSASNSGKGHESASETTDGGGFKPTAIAGGVPEEEAQK